MTRISIAVIAMLIIAGCEEKNTKIVSIYYHGTDTSQHVKFRATIITGDSIQTIETKTPYSITISNKPFMITAIPFSDTVELTMESWGNTVRSSRVTGRSYAGMIFYLPPNGGPGYMGSPK